MQVVDDDRPPEITHPAAPLASVAAKADTSNEAKVSKRKETIEANTTKEPRDEERGEEVEEEEKEEDTNGSPDLFSQQRPLPYREAEEASQQISLGESQVEEAKPAALLSPVSRKATPPSTPVSSAAQTATTPQGASVASTGSPLDQELIRVAGETGDDVASVCRLLEQGAGLTANNKWGHTALMAAAAKGNVQVMRQLLKNPSVKLEERSNLGVTALHYAAGNGCIEAVELLLANGADWRAKDLRGRTPYDMARRNGCEQCVAVLGRLMEQAAASQFPSP
jgi:hypothetical protein